MRKQTRNGWMLSSSLVFALALTVGMFTGAVAQAQSYWTGGGDDNLWSNPDNWDTAEAPTDLGDHAYVNLAGEQVEMDVGIDASGTRTQWRFMSHSGDIPDDGLTDKTVVDLKADVTINSNSYDWQMVYGDNGDVAGVISDVDFNINDGATLSLGQLFRTGSGSHNATATINVESGGTFVSRGDGGMRNYLASAYGPDVGNGGTGILNIESGARATFGGGQSLTLNRYDGGRASVKVAGGDLDIAGSISSSQGASEYIVEGTGRNFDDTGSNTINIGGDFSVLNANHADDFVRLLADDGGVTTTQIGGNFSVGDGAVLDLGFLDESAPNYDTWTAFSWDGDLVDGGGTVIDAATAEGYLSLHGDVDQSIWSFDIQTGNSGSLTVTAVPEPSSLVLLGIAGLLLMKRRRV